MAAVMDFHTHLLPGVDDGSASVEEAVAMLRMEGNQGIRRVAATPHFYPRYDDPEAFLARRQAAAEALAAEMALHPGLPRFTLGAEVAFFRGMSESELLPRLTMGKKRCILVEMPPAPWPEEIFRELIAIREKQDILPIVAHIDRYITRWRSFGIPKRLAELPVLVQANAGFFLEKSTASMAIGMLKKDRIHLLGSDCHNLTTRRPNLGPALEVIRQNLGEEPLARIRDYEKMIFVRN